MIEVGVENDDTDQHVKIAAWLLVLASVTGMIGIFLKGQSLLAILLGFAIMAPFIATFLLLALPDRLFATNIYLEPHNNGIRKESRWLRPTFKIKVRDYRDVTAILLVQDTTHYGSLGTGPRFRLFFCLGQKTIRRRVLYIDNVKSAEAAAKAAQQISRFTGWPIEFLTLDRTITDRDIIWESW